MPDFKKNITNFKITLKIKLPLNLQIYNGQATLITRNTTNYKKTEVTAR